MTDENVIKSVGVAGGMTVAQWIEQIYVNGKDWKTAIRTAELYGFEVVGENNYLQFRGDLSKLYLEGGVINPTKVWTE